MIIAVLITCFNRKAQTLVCLQSLANQALVGSKLEIFLVDDGSTDGTAETVQKEFPQIQIISGNGALYWCGGMRKAWLEATKIDPDFYLLLNDDTILKPKALAILVDIAGMPESRVIAVAAIQDPKTGSRTYGGIEGGGKPVEMRGKLEICQTFNANAVLVPRSVYKELGIFHSSYTHGMGDFDYGYQATKRGIRVIQSAEFLGECERNTLQGSWLDKSLPRKKRWRLLKSPKGLPFKEWMIFNQRNSGLKWPLKTISPYIRVILGL